METPIPYHEFRTGLTYADVYHMIYTRKHKRRNGVLGFWRELKQRMYAEYCAGVASGPSRWVDTGEPIPE